MLILSGCGAVDDSKKVISSVNMVTPIPCDTQKLQNDYPEWFDEEGHIVYPIKPGTKEYKKLYNASENF